MAAKKGKSWQGRLKADTDASAAELIASIDIDRALWRYDIKGSLAHAEMLRRTGVLTASELVRIKKGLSAVGAAIESGRLAMPIELEDIHMIVEKALIDRIGEPGRKLHTGRSRNDQVALDLRMWAKDTADELVAGVRGLQRSLVATAEKFGLTGVPAYTHLQRAQPVVAGHALLAYVEMLQRDAERLADARKRMDVCPLGSGAVAGSSLPLDRRMTARLLGFSDLSRNSIDATSDRDFLAELCFCCALLAVHLSRWAEDWIIYSSSEFGMIELDDAFCTSSSMMPQKKNADTLELIRAKSASAIGALAGMLALLKGLPLAYNRDLQDDKRLVMPVVSAVVQALAVASGIVRTASFNRARIEASLDRGYLDATSLAEYLVKKGVAFRTAHQAVGRLVAEAESAGKCLAELPLETLRRHCDRIGPDVYGHLGAANAASRYATAGAGGPKQFKAQLKAWKRRLNRQ